MSSKRHVFLVVIVVFTILSLLLSACGPIDTSNGNNKDKDKDQGNEKEKGNDKDKDKENKDNYSNTGKITICHRTGSAKNPYVEITVSENAINDGHATHEEDLIPAPEGGCPDIVITDADVPAK